MAKASEKKKKSVIWTVILVIAVCVCAYSAYRVIKIAMDYRKGTDEFRPDFASLQEQNPDCIAWIRFPNIDINYPVVQGTDNDYYLKHTFLGEQVTAASIFMDFNNRPDFTDDNTIIYGHNMKNGSMFAKLNRFSEESYYKENPYFWIYTPTAVYRYDIFSCHVVNVENEEMYCRYGDAEEFMEYVIRLKQESDYPIDMEITSGDRIVTLYTCNSAGSDYRYQVHAKQAAAYVTGGDGT